MMSFETTSNVLSEECAELAHRPRCHSERSEASGGVGPPPRILRWSSENIMLVSTSTTTNENSVWPVPLPLLTG